MFPKFREPQIEDYRYLKKNTDHCTENGMKTHVS